MRRALLAAALSLCAFPALARMQVRPVEWTVGKDRFSGVLVYDDAVKAKRPGLAMVPDWLGVTPAAVAKAKQQAGRDYVILVVDMYGKGVRPKNNDEALKQVIARNAGGDHDRAVTIRADALSSHQSVVTAMDALGQLGFTHLSMATTPTHPGATP